MVGLAFFFIAAFVLMYGKIMRRKIVGTIGFMVMLGVLFVYPEVVHDIKETLPGIGGPISNGIK
ncbi:hypothetical protein [Priestia megaterium]|uniref:hypothetical protein n=1 Tax=Priestia megaterium TaxID=1404 RepID=UPI00272FB275|nr:hypothetical protein [Priestia megaterium]MDP1443069.1 hypothetical protein [Priestia megaterium]MDP1472265.1 hypothetical protein [Priestia megaterium]